jgi:hypothetical protein
MENTISAASNPSLANQLLAQATAEPEQSEIKAELSTPSEILVDLPGGYVTADGEVIRTAEVRELTGRDEEAIARSANVAKALNIILTKGVVKVGNLEATERLLDSLLTGDRDALMLGIYRATFGNTAAIGGFCPTCTEVKEVIVDVREDISNKVLLDPVNDRVFPVKGKKGEYIVTLPTGLTQKEIISNSDKNTAELSTILLQSCVLEINGKSVLSKEQVRNLGVADRQTLNEEIAERNPGPQFDDVKVTCPECDGEVVVPINLGTLFRF